MATTTHQADELPLQPVPFHLCDDRLDRDFDDLDGYELGEESENLRSHAECPMPDGYGLPSTDCVVYRKRFVCSNHRGIPADFDVIVCGDTSRTMAFFDATRRGAQLEEQGQKVLEVTQATSRGMGWQASVRISVVHPIHLGEWYRDVAEETLVAAVSKLPTPPRVPVEARAVQTTERPGAWSRVLDSNATRREVLRRLEAEERGAA